MVSIREGGTIVLLASDELGSGSAELGQVLMRSFLKTLREVQSKPSRILFLNRGVRMVVEGSAFLPELEALAEAGIDLASCGTCLDYFQVKDKVRAGRVTNMQDIVAALLGAEKVVRP